MTQKSHDYDYVGLNGKNFSWTNVEAGSPQGCILGQLFLLIYISDLPDNLSTNLKLFADDSSVFFSSRYHYFLSRLELWFKQRVREWAF